jgi:hypothetical protein
MNDRLINALCWTIVIAAALTFVDPWLDYCSDLVTLGIAWIALGVLFLAAYFFAHKSGVLRGLMWICQYLSRPAGRGMAFFWFAFFVFLGAMSLSQGLGLAGISGFSRSRLVFNSLNAQRVSCPTPSVAR